MDKLTNRMALLDTIRLSEGANFECDEKAILNEYNLQKENKSRSIKILSVFGGFLGMLSFLGFLALAGLYDSEFGLLLFGTGFIVAAIWLNKEYDKLIIDTFSISIYILGFILVAFGLLQLEVDENVIVLLISLIAICSLFITQNYILSFISILTVSCSFFTLIILNDLYDLIHLYIAVNSLILAYVFLNEAKIISASKKLCKLYNPIRIGLVFSLLLGLIAIGNKDLVPLSSNYSWLSSIVIIAVILYIVYSIIKINEIIATKSKLLIYFLSCLLFISTLFSPSISGAIVIILLSFLVNYKTGLVIGIISFIYFISQFYYDLNLTLLTKSIILVSSGIVFLMFYLFTTKKLHLNEKI